MTQIKSPSQEMELVHYGVKGMQWGVRNAKSSGQDIKDARARQDQRHRQLIRFSDEVDTASSPKQAKTAETKARKIAADIQTNEDRVTAARMTRGEKAVSIIIAGPAGLAVIGGNKIRVHVIAKNVDKLRDQVK